MIALYGTFDTADVPLSLAPATQAMWVKLFEISLKRRTRMEWTSTMIEHGIPASPINTLEDVFNDPHGNQAPPLLGEHTRAVFSDFGFSQADINQLIESKVIHQAG